MRLTWKDAVATGTAALALAAYIAFLVEADLPLLADVRSTTIVVAVLGLIGSSFSGINEAFQRRLAGPKLKLFRAAIGTAWVAALSAGVLAFITESETMLAIFVIGAMVAWLMVTMRHLFVQQANPFDNRDKTTSVR